VHIAVQIFKQGHAELSIDTGSKATGAVESVFKQVEDALLQSVLILAISRQPRQLCVSLIW